MQCPSCSSYNLKPTKLDLGLPARICGRCHGIHLNMLSYRTWLESNPIVHTDERDSDITAVDNETVLSCPSCARLMLKFVFQSSNETANHLDVCTHCEDVWLDSGEWQLLKHLNRHTKLGSMMTDHWQIENIRENEKDNFETRYATMLGAEDYTCLVKTKEWLNKNPNKKEIIHYLLKNK